MFLALPRAAAISLHVKTNEITCPWFIEVEVEMAVFGRMNGFTLAN
jgi:hypothetical protein